jgi:hypothetical protein
VGNYSGPYTDMAEFTHFVVEGTYEKGSLNEARRALQRLERLW